MTTQEQNELDLEKIVDESNNKEDTVITLDQDGKEIKTTDSSADGKGAQGSSTPAAEDTIAALKKEIEAAKAREAEYQGRVAKLESEHQSQIKKATTAIDNEFKARETSVENSISAAKKELDAIKVQLKDAREKGDIDKEIELEEKLADTRYQYNASLWQKENLATQKKAQEDAIKNATVNNQNPDGTRRFSAREQKWIDEHPKYNTDEDFQALVWSLDSQAKKKGIIPDTDAYYDYLNTRLEKMFPTEQAPVGGTTVTVPVPKAATTVAISTAAPVGRGSGASGANGQSVTQIRLTPAQLEAAEFMGMSPVEYAQDLINQQKEKAGR